MNSHLRRPVGCSHILFFAIIYVINMINIPYALSDMRNDAIRDAIVKIYSVSSRPDYFNPWKLADISRVGGSGSIIEGNVILTNAHVVADSTFIEVKRQGQPRRYKARIIYVSHEADLALLTIDDRSFFSGMSPLEIGELPEALQEVLVYGFPIGGESLSITKGILSRIEHQNYVHSSHDFLAGQIDAAINPGNSGGPVVVDGHVVGVVMQSYSPLHSESLGYMVPSTVIQHFLQDIADSRYDGFPEIGVVTQNMDNQDLKQMYRMSRLQTGIVVIHVHPGSPAEGKIEEGDILIAVNRQLIADDGTVEFRPGERTSYTYYVDLLQVGNSVDVELIRNGKMMEVKLVLERTRNELSLVDSERYDQMPRYFIFGGIVFSPLTKNLVMRWGRRWRSKAPPEMVIEMSNWPTDDRNEVVVALQVLADDINRGYHDIKNWVVDEVNGQRFRDFNEFFRAIVTSDEPYIVLKNKKGYQVVIDSKKARESHKRILETYNIKKGHSSDLKALVEEIDPF